MGDVCVLWVFVSVGQSLCLYLSVGVCVFEFFGMLKVHFQNSQIAGGESMINCM